MLWVRQEMCIPESFVNRQKLYASNSSGKENTINTETFCCKFSLISFHSYCLTLKVEVYHTGISSHVGGNGYCFMYY